MLRPGREKCDSDNAKCISIMLVQLLVILLLLLLIIIIMINTIVIMISMIPLTRRMLRPGRERSRCLRKNTPFIRALAMLSSGGNSSPAPDLCAVRTDCSKGLLLRRSVFFTDIGINAKHAYD